MLKYWKFKNNEKAWADYLITRAGLAMFCAILLLSAFTIPSLFTRQNEAGMLDAELCSLASTIEDVDRSNIRSIHYYKFDEQRDINISITSRYVSASSQITTGKITRAQALIREIHPSNSIWINRSGLLNTIAGMCDNRTGRSDNILIENDLVLIDEMLQHVKTELANESFIPDTAQPMIIEKMILNYRTPEGIKKRGITIVYQ